MFTPHRQNGIFAPSRRGPVSLCPRILLSALRARLWLTRLVALWAFVALQAMEIRVQAAAVLWTGTAGAVWSETNNWTGLVLPGTLDTGSFNAGTPLSVYLNGEESVFGLSFAGVGGGTLYGGSFETVSSNTLTLGVVGANANGGISLGARTGPVTFDSSVRLVLNGDSQVSTAFGTTLNLLGDLGGSGTLWKTGDGVLRLGGTSASGFTGDVAVSGGMLVVRGASVRSLHQCRVWHPSHARGLPAARKGESL